MSQFFLGFDLETGGLDPTKTDLLTGYFCIMDESFKILEELSLKLKPDGRLPIAEEGALKTNGINIENHLKDPETMVYAEGAKKITALVKKYLKKKGRYSNILPFGYNILTFDILWAQHHLIDKTTWESMIHYKSVDVMQHVDALKFYGWLPPTCGNLGSMVEFFNIPKGEAHVARDDVLMTVGVLRKLRELMDSKKNGGNNSDLISLLEAE